MFIKTNIMILVEKDNSYRVYHSTEVCYGFSSFTEYSLELKVLYQIDLFRETEKKYERYHLRLIVLHTIELFREMEK